MTVGGALKKYHNIEIDLLLAFVLKKSREFLYLWPNHRLTQKQTNRLTRMVQRRIKGEPMAYILGYKDFMGHRFAVNKDVLIPRPETEEIVERILNKELGIRNKKSIRILDVGTGSGCIAISLAKELSIKNYEVSITASDISEKALVVARQNAKMHKVKIKFKHSDILQNVGMLFDVVVANLPYLPSEALAKEGGWSEWKNNSSVETVGLKFEPKQALFTKEKGLYLIHRLLYQISMLKQKPKYIFLEFGPRQKIALAKLIKKILPKASREFFKDYAGHWRVAVVKS